MFTVQRTQDRSDDASIYDAYPYDGDLKKSGVVDEDGDEIWVRGAGEKDGHEHEYEREHNDHEVTYPTERVLHPVVAGRPSIDATRPGAVSPHENTRGLRSMAVTEAQSRRKEVWDE